MKPRLKRAIEAMTTLYNIKNDQERVRLIMAKLGIPMIIGVLGDKPIRVQVKVAN